MSEPVITTETQASAPRGRFEPETYRPRVVDRELAPWLHEDFKSATNFRGDVELMLQIGMHFGLDERDFKFLNHVRKTAIRHAETRRDEVVSLSDRQWNIFQTLRRRFNRAYRNPSTFMNYAKATRGTDAQSSTAASTIQN